MKRLLLLFILFPVISFGQIRRGDIVDSIQAKANDLKAVAELINNNKGTVVDLVHASDSGEYINMVVRVRVIEAVVIKLIPSLPVVAIPTGTIVPGTVSAVADLPVLPPVTEGYAMIAVPQHTVALFDMETVVAGTMRAVTKLPALPPVTDGYAIGAIPFATVELFSIKAVVADPNMITIPPFRDIMSDIVDTLPLVAPVMLAIAYRPAGTMDTIVVVVYEEKKMPVDEMHLSEAGYDLLEKLEGFSPHLYALKDGGFTIGFGFFIPFGDGHKWNKGVTWEEGERIMREKVPQYEDQVKQYINVPVTQYEFDALTMIAYNLGGFSKATSIVNDINSGADFDRLQKDWMRFVHSKAPGVMKGLMNRRKDELNVRNASDYQPERKIQILKNIK